MSMESPYPAPQQSASPMAIASLILGILGLLGGIGGCCCCLSHVLTLCAPVAAILGHLEGKAIREGRSPKAGATMAQVGMILGLVGTGIMLLYLLFVVGWIVIAGFGTVMETITRGRWH